MLKIGKSFINYKSYVYLFIYIPRTFKILRVDLVGAIMKMSLVIATRQIAPRVASNEEAGDSYLPLVFFRYLMHCYKLVISLVMLVLPVLLRNCIWITCVKRREREVIFHE